MQGRLLVALVSATLPTEMAGLRMVHAVFHQRIAHLWSLLSYAEIGIHHVQTLVQLDLVTLQIASPLSNQVILNQGIQ